MQILPFRKKDKVRIIKDIRDQVKIVRRRFDSPAEMFTKIRSNFSRLELMIIDSALKTMPMDSLDKILLLKHETYLELLQTVTKKLKNLEKSKT